VTPAEIAKTLKEVRGGHGETVIHMHRKYVKGVGKGMNLLFQKNGDSLKTE